MKLRSTTPASIKLRGRALLIFIAVLTAIVVPVQTMTKSASADQYDDRINELQAQINQYRAESDRLNQEAVTLQSTLSRLNSEKQAVQTQIDLNQTKYDKLLVDIANTEKKIKENQDALGITIANLYVDDKITPIEMLASSKNISEYLDKQEYRNSVRDELTSTIAKIKELKKSLDEQKVAVEKVLADQKEQRSILVAKQNEQQALLDQTKGDEASYQKMIGNNQAAIAEAKATQAMMNARYASSGGATYIDTGLLSDYPWNESNCSMSGYWSLGGADGNGGDGRGYGCRQCASYVAWRIAKETGRYYSWGNAVNFTQNAINAGYEEGAPRAGSIAVMDPATSGASEGHVAWVEAVNGNTVTISQYNYNYGAGYGMYSLMNLSVSAFDHYVHIK